MLALSRITFALTATQAGNLAVSLTRSVTGALASIALLASSERTVANDQSQTLNACWSQSELRAKPGERRIRRKHRSKQHTGPRQPLAAYSPVPKHLRGSIRRVDLPKDKPWIALTLDFCEQAHEIAGYDGAIIDLLRQLHVPATLYLGGHWMRSHANRTHQLMLDPLFELANHGDAHRNLRHLSGKRLNEEILAPQHAYEAMRTNLMQKQCMRKTTSTVQLPERLTQFRFPFGACSKQAMDAVNDAGLLAIQWDFSSWDSSRAQSARRIARRMLREVRRGSIILAHGNGRGYNTAAALKLAIPRLRKKGFKFVTVSEMLAAGKPVVSRRCYNVRPGDTDRYGRGLYRRSKTKKTKPWTLWTN